MILQDSPQLSDSYLTCIVETKSLCLSSHEDVNTFKFQQATMFTATLLFQPQLIRTLYIQLQMIKHIIRHFLVLNTCTQTLFHTRHIREMQEIFRRAHNNKRQYFIESFSDKKCELQTWTCLKVVFVLFHRFTHLLALGTPLGVLIVWNPYRITPIHWLMARMPAPTFSCRENVILCMRARHLFLHEAAMLALLGLPIFQFSWITSPFALRRLQ